MLKSSRVMRHRPPHSPKSPPHTPSVSFSRSCSHIPIRTGVHSLSFLCTLAVAYTRPHPLTHARAHTYTPLHTYAQVECPYACDTGQCLGPSRTHRTCHSRLCVPRSAHRSTLHCTTLQYCVLCSVSLHWSVFHYTELYCSQLNVYVVKNAAICGRQWKMA
jgi:hypothetical protein